MDNPHPSSASQTTSDRAHCLARRKSALSHFCFGKTSDHHHGLNAIPYSSRPSRFSTALTILYYKVVSVRTDTSSQDGRHGSKATRFACSSPTHEKQEPGSIPICPD
ncbi:hypothetical protein BDP81DRAFT_110084 [Colletotrichum phormii]|uniref:Uncharacterized protein n=1 Tax=Colletotrichum phormii TaxID=359342 RepID=A0AAI9ZH63_9PEZI|nr:uncharacterized protein BDP81DRAFT_110084 [Colletotrichum phormii]KAK1624518.1 hypothetical protein BDP81DRAFT_110084 [Colletotrichum phormii]